jgi:hypothetical protein
LLFQDKLPRVKRGPIGFSGQMLAWRCHFANTSLEVFPPR